jgi:molybdopterin-guanine dinucleotide biosynthesis protein A
MTTDGFVLVGGRSRRMGRDKAAMLLDGVPFAVRIARSMAPLVSAVRLVGRCEGIGNLEAIPDVRAPGQGPLAGIEAALDTCIERALLVACDLPFVATDLLAYLIKIADGAPGEIVVPVDAAGRPALLCGVYPRAALSNVTALLDAGERRPRALIDHWPSRLVAVNELRDLAHVVDSLVNINTMEDLAAALGKPVRGPGPGT